MKQEIRIKMEIEKYKETLTQPLRQATLCFCLENDKMLLGMKKRGFAEGRWNGAGGKPKPEDKNIEDTATRETQEEFDIKPINLKKVAVINFFFPDNPDWSQQVHVYLCNKWEGDPKELEEMMPEWFNIKEIPFDKMWDDDQYWLPLVLKGLTIEADFMFDKDQKIIDQYIKDVTER